MKRALIWLIVGVPLGVFIWWIASNTYWADTVVPMPPKGEALRNPFYVVQRFAEALGARTTWDRVLITPPADSVIVLSSWHWSLSTWRREALERWVEAGGRLIVDSRLAGGEEEFERWSGIVREYREPAQEQESVPPERRDPCRKFHQTSDAMPAGEPTATGYWMCEFEVDSFLRSAKNADWVLRDPSGIQVMRVAVGRGRVTLINAAPFRERSLFDGDHGWLFVAATQLRRGDDVHFLSEEDHPSLLALIWQHGAPFVLVSSALIVFALWRGAVRFGPPAAPEDNARRSLAEQIRGTGQFALRHGSGESLHAATVRALDEAGERRIPSYARLVAIERAAAVARLTGFDTNAIATAVHHPRARRSHELRGTIALLEAARRMLIEHTRARHGRR